MAVTNVFAFGLTTSIVAACAYAGSAHARPAPEPEGNVLSATANVDFGHIELPVGADPGPGGLPGYPPPNPVNPATGVALYPGSAEWKVHIYYNKANPDQPRIGAWIQLSTFKSSSRWDQYYGESEFRLERCVRKTFPLVASSEPFFSQDLTGPGEYIRATSQTNRRYVFGQTFQEIEPIVRTYSASQMFRVVITQRVASVKGAVGAPILILSPTNPWRVATPCLKLK